MAIREISSEEIEAVNGGYLKVLSAAASFFAGHVAGKLIDKLDGGPNGQPFEMTPELEALAAGNMTA